MAVDDDLYGDLDLDEIDAEAELVDPPPLVSSPTGPTGGAASSSTNPNANLNANTSTNATQNPNQNQPFGGSNSNPQGNGMAGGSGPGGFQAGGAMGGGFGGLDVNMGGGEQGRAQGADSHDEGKMFIGGLNWETTDDGLKAYMGKYGEIDSCTIMRDPTGRSRGFAFLTYKDASSVNAVMNQTHMLDGKQIDPKRAIPRAEHERTAKVFVGGLAPGVTGEILKNFLSQFGMVMDATVMYDKETQRSKGFAFATFQDEDSVGRAMEVQGLELEGKQIEIKKAQPRGSGNLPNKFGTGGNSKGNNQFGGGGNQGGNFGNNMMAAGGMGGGFDPNAMAMMYQNMVKGASGGAGGNMGMGGAGGFDPNAMAMMYQSMMKNMAGMNAPAINPNMAMRGMGGMAGMGGMGMMGMGGMGGTGGMGGMGNMGGMMGMGNMGGGGMGNMGGGYGGGMGRQPGGNMQGTRPIPNAPRGPAAMRGGSSGPSSAGGAAAAGTGNMANSGAPGGPGAQRYSTQGSARAKPY